MAATEDSGSENNAAVHATALALDGVGIMIQGPSGTGKSRLAFSLLEAAGCKASSSKGPQSDADTALIGDDYITLDPGPDGYNLLASPVPNLAGLIEVRSIGILGLPWRASSVLRLSVELASLDDIERLPETDMINVQGRALRQLRVPIGDLAHQMVLVRTAASLITS
jgi:serine kinase of HPr protein (carbohydrate metabolism regulator)